MITGNVQNAIGGEEAITTKRIGLFKELVPNLTRLGMIGFATNISNLEHNGLRKASSHLGFEVLRYNLQRPSLDGLDDAVSAGLRDDISAFYISGYFVIFGHIPQVVASVAKSGRPIWSMAFGSPAFKWRKFFEERSRATCQSNRQTSSRWPST
jgi:putative ABC transport system substrate-binding protein